MTRDEWILEHVPTVKIAVRAFCRQYAWAGDLMDDLEGEAFVRLTAQAERLAKANQLIDKPGAYVFRLTWNSCFDYIKKQEREFTPIPSDHFRVETGAGATGPYFRRYFGGFLTIFKEYTKYSGVGIDNNSGERLPMSEDMGEEELAALEAFINCGPENAWQRSKLRRRALTALRKLGITFDAHITRYTVRAKCLEKGGDGSRKGELNRH